jgi:hypothetical protein
MMFKSKYYLGILLLILSAMVEASDKLVTTFEKGNGNQTATYHEVIEFYQQLATQYDSVTMEAVGMTDAGLPLHKVSFQFERVLKNNKKSDVLTLLINNGIHPGEPDGIDATMMLFRNFAQGKIEAPENTVLVTIPVYNVGGALNRNSTTRTNQNGPESYGFRGNARNYDLNRDFIKADTLNARAFITIFHQVKPDVFIDNHVSNGADYQYVLTHLMTQHNKLGGQLGSYLKNSFQPALEKKLAEKDWPITPYVNVFNRSPDDGFSQFFDSPRYSTGYTTLFNTMGMMLETHMLKPYKQRVLGTYAFMQTVIHLADKDAKKIKKFRQQAFENYQTGDNYPIQWQLDDEKFSSLDFLGYQANTVTSEVTGLDRLKYNRQQPYRKKIKYKDSYKPSISVRIPKAYIIPQGWHRVINLLTLNQIHMRQLEKETTWDVEVYRIEDYTTNTNVYEGHYPHKTLTISRSTQQVTFRAGDYYIATDQPGVRYLLEVLEPEATDSFFKWNFFDTVLSQKEGFSPYVWEDHALHLLAENPALKESFNSKKTSDPQFAHNAYQQLQWLHRKSKHYEKAHLNYPVYRLP